MVCVCAVSLLLLTGLQHLQPRYPNHYPEILVECREEVSAGRTKTMD